MSSNTEFILQQSLNDATDLLTDFINQPEVGINLSVAFGADFDTTQGIALLESLVNDNFNNLPTIEIRSSSELNNARGAYSVDTNTIYLSEQFLTENADNTDIISQVIVEEIGHFVDAEVNTRDAPGDEGAIFASLVTGEELDAATLDDLQNEDDSATINLDGETIAVEQAGNILYVDGSASGSNNGSSWGNAYTRLQDALDDAESGDEIWVAKGTYRPTTTTDKSVSFVLPDGVKMYGGFAGTETNKSQKDSAKNVTILSGDIGTIGNISDNSYTVVDISGTSSNAVVEGFTITGGNNDQSYGYGGGIYSEEGNATLANLIITKNNAVYGGGFYATDSENRLVNVRFYENSATYRGGAIYNDDGSLNISESIFNDNSGINAGGAIYNNGSNDDLEDLNLTDVTFNSNRTNDNGGAIYSYQSDSTSLTDVRFFNNSAIDDGGAIYNSGGSSELTDVSFQKNTAINQGGAVFNSGGDGHTIVDSTFYSNIANNGGGGIYNNRSATTVVNNVFDRNISSFGSGIYNSDNNSSVINSTFSNNVSRNGAAITSDGRDTNTTNITNSILWGNRSYVDGQPIDTQESDVVVNVSNSIVQGGYSGDDVINQNPKFVDPSKFDYRLQTGSPALNKGNNDAIEDYTTDIAGNTRIVGDNVDLGAYEGAKVGSQPTLPVATTNPTIIYVNGDSTGDNDGTSWRNAYTDLQDALADAPFGSQIWVAEGVYKPDDDDDREASFQLKNGVAIYGGFTGEETALNQRDVQENITTLSGDVGQADNSDDNSYHVVDASNTNNSAILDGFYIQEGNANGSTGTNVGGGIYSNGSQAIIANLIIQNNQASANGGGMYSLDSVHQISNVKFIDNKAGVYGAGLYNYSSGSILTNVTFQDNQAQSNGGAIYNYSSGGFLTNVTFRENEASNGGAVYSDVNSDPVFDRAYFIENTATLSGGALYNTSTSNPNLTNVLFRDNSAVTSGGAIYNNRGAGEKVVNGVFDGNSSELGGAIYNNSASPTGINVTFTNNQADSGAAIYSYGNEDTTPTYNNSIFWGNQGESDSDPIVNDQTYTANTIVSHSIVEDDYDGIGVIDKNPNFVDSDDNLRLKSNSPAINAGLNDPIVGLTNKDIVGNNRIVGSKVDLGAYEYSSGILDDTDLVWRNQETGANTLWVMDGTTKADSVALDPITDTDWEVQALGDFNKDGDRDLLWRNTSTGNNVIWVMDGATKDSSVSLESVPDSGWNIKGVGDFDKDGYQDILWRDETTGSNAIWLMDGTTKRDVVYIDTVSNLDLDIKGVGDFDKDGYQDIVWRNEETGSNSVWLMDGINKRDSVALDSVPVTWELKGVGSFNGGTNPDLLWRNSDTGENLVWIMNGTTKNSSVLLDPIANSDWTVTV
ncbi:MAG: hypothetical protein Tsb0014_43140 [Pleurocapsa sp.]